MIGIINSQKIKEIEETHIKYFEDNFLNKIPSIRSSHTRKWKKFFDFVEKNYRIIILGRPLTLKRIIKSVDKIFPKISTKKDHEAKEDILKIFNYSAFSTNCGAWNAYKYVEMLGIKTCPYCNLSYLTMIPKKGKNGGLRPDLDHFFPKSKHPYLALSLYNLIPSCSNCNSRLKRDKDDTELLNPYEGGFGEFFQFRTNLDDVESIYEAAYKIKELRKENTDFKLKIREIKELEDGAREADFVEKVNNNIDVFKLNQQYEFHKDYVHEILNKEMLYNKTRIKDLQENYPGLFDENEVRQSIFSTYFEDKDLHKRPLSKLTKDILNEFKIVK